VVEVPDPEATADFLATGLDCAVQQSGDRWQVSCEGEYGAQGQAPVELVPGTEMHLADIVFALPEGVDEAKLAQRTGGTRTDAGGVTLTEPGGLRVSLEPREVLRVERPATSVLRPRRLGHVNAKSPRPSATARFYREVLGLALSEQIGEDLYFLRTDTEHHNVGLRPGDRGEVHHLGFEVAGWHAYQPILDHLDAVGYGVEYGPGKHRPGLSYFTYVRDPSSGLRLELFADMAHITTGPDTPAITWEAGDRMTRTINCWGPLPPESFLA
jgi:catechol 2,3-dioxygenase-like lactoylglutathione lyase family enzyme